MIEKPERSGSGSPTTPALIAWLEEEARKRRLPASQWRDETYANQFQAAADALRSLPEERDTLRAMLDNLTRLIKEKMGERYRRVVDEASGDISVNTAFAVAIDDEREASRIALEAAEAEVARLQLERDRWFVECERLATGLIETFQERVDEDHDGDLKPEDAVDVAFRLCDDLVKSEAEVARLTQARDTLQQLSNDDLILIRECVRPLDCGALYCRYCSAKELEAWQHSEHCPYADSVKKVEQARALLDRLQKSGAEAGPLPSPQEAIALNALVQQWRIEAEHQHGELAFDASHAFTLCADQLQDALKAARSTASGQPKITVADKATEGDTA